MLPLDGTGFSGRLTESFRFAGGIEWRLLTGTCEWPEPARKLVADCDSEVRHILCAQKVALRRPSSSPST